MIQMFWIVIAVTCSIAVTGCNSNESAPQKPSETSSPAAAKAQVSSADALAFLKALQIGDKKQLYAASRLTADSVEESRTKLTNIKKYKLTAEQRTEVEHPLRISGSIDFYLKKVSPLFRGAEIKITDSTRVEPPRIPMLVHAVKITYKDLKHAPVDSGGRQHKEINFRLQQMERKANGVELREFVIDNDDFIEIMDRNYRNK